MNLLHLCQSEDGIWLHVTPAKGPVAAINLLTTLSARAGIVRKALRAAEEEQNTPVMGLSLSLWNDLVKAAQESPWLPKEYMANDWVADLCQFLREPRDVLPMPTKKAYYTGTSINSFRPGCRALILGIFFVTPPGSEPRPCFALRYEDGIMDFSPVSDISNYQLFSE